MRDLADMDRDADVAVGEIILDRRLGPDVAVRLRKRADREEDFALGELFECAACVYDTGSRIPLCPNVANGCRRPACWYAHWELVDPLELDLRRALRGEEDES